MKERQSCRLMIVKAVEEYPESGGVIERARVDSEGEGGRGDLEGGRG